MGCSAEIVDSVEVCGCVGVEVCVVCVGNSTLEPEEVGHIDLCSL